MKALVRREEDGKLLQSTHPNLEPIIGSLTDHDLIRRTAASVEFVIHATKEDLPAVLALIDGLAQTHGTKSPTPRLISISGTRSLIDLSVPVTGKDNENVRPWSDVANVKTILSLPRERPHAEADQATITHASANGLGAMVLLQDSSGDAAKASSPKVPLLQSRITPQ